MKDDKVGGKMMELMATITCTIEEKRNRAGTDSYFSTKYITIATLLVNGYSLAEGWMIS